MTEIELQNHIRDILEDNKNPLLPEETRIKLYARALYNEIYDRDKA